MNENLTTFTGKVRRFGGSLGITIDDRVVKYEGIEEGDFLKVMIVKMPKKEVLQE